MFYNFLRNLKRHVPRPAVGALVSVEATVRVHQQERLAFKLRFVEVANGFLLLRVDLEHRCFPVVGDTVHPTPRLNQRVSFVNVGCREVRLVCKNQRVLALNVFLVEILSVTKGKHTIDERQRRPELGPCTNNDKFAVRVCSFDRTANCSCGNVLSKATLNLEDRVFFLSHE